MKIDKDGWIINPEGIWVGTIDHVNKEIRPTHGYYPDFTECFQTDWKKVIKIAKKMMYAYMVDGLDLTVPSNYKKYKEQRHHPCCTPEILNLQKSSKWN